MQNATIKKWVPPYTPPRAPDLFYIYSILSTLWREADGTLPRLGNPEDPLDDLIYLMLTRRGQIRQAQQLFESLRQRLINKGHKKPDWSAFLDQGIEAMTCCLAPLGMGRIRAREMHAALTIIRDRFGQLSLDPLRRWSNTRCIEFLCSLPGLSLKTAACVMLYTLGRRIFPSDVHCNRVIARLGVLPAEYGRQDKHKKAQRLLSECFAHRRDRTHGCDGQAEAVRSSHLRGFPQHLERAAHPVSRHGECARVVRRGVNSILMPLRNSNRA